MGSVLAERHHPLLRDPVRGPDRAQGEDDAGDSADADRRDPLRSVERALLPRRAVHHSGVRRRQHDVPHADRGRLPGALPDVDPVVPLDLPDAADLAAAAGAGDGRGRGAVRGGGGLTPVTLRTILVGLAVAAVSACGGPPAPGSSGEYLENAVWRLASIDDIRLDASDENGPWLRATSVDGRVQGSTGCNSFTGPYRAGGTEVAFGPLATTRRACADPSSAEIERRMLELLQSADGYRVGSGRLEVMVEGRIRMLFTASR
ncbi:MAG: META domain-containing protein [Gemmatimonadetes bacterium]|nr:META domain-containing protein [Gemmatimonadota bacterium]